MLIAVFMDEIKKSMNKLKNALMLVYKMTCLLMQMSLYFAPINMQSNVGQFVESKMYKTSETKI